MIGNIFNTIFYEPIYNGLIFLLHAIPVDVGVAIIIVTIIVKLILFPLSLSSVKSQHALKEVQPEIDALKEKHKDNPQKQAEETFALYRERNIKPFRGFLTLLIQLPVIFALYYVFLRGGLPEISMDILYPFVKAPEMVSMKFLGLIDMAEKSIILALLAGITQYIQMNIALPSTIESEGKQLSPMAGVTSKMKYFFPPIVIIISYSLSGAIALYWTTSNLFHLAQEFLVKRKFEKTKEEQE